MASNDAEDEQPVSKLAELLGDDRGKTEECV